ncbi:MAG: hypothetical protein LBI10_05985 [Deltaproteobacteria bacterium]|jgi:phage host-nuclease inhibitor protein Gam|nr:hypothetical protein [Deltaproteobacteria bacterium]
MNDKKQFDPESTNGVQGPAFHEKLSKLELPTKDNDDNFSQQISDIKDQLSRLITDVNAKIDVFNVKFGDVTTNFGIIVGFSREIGDIDTKIVEFNVELSGKIDVLTSKYEAIISQIDAIRSKVETLTSIINGVNSKIDGVNVELTREISAFKVELTNKISAVKDDLTNKISAVKDDLTNKISAVKDDLTLEISAVKDDLTLEISAVNSKIDVVKVEFTKISSSFADTQQTLNTCKKFLFLISIAVGASILYYFVQKFLLTLL